MARSLDDYVTVHERLQTFWTAHEEDGQIQTEMAFPNEKTVRCRAVVSVAGVIRATGHAEEVRSGPVNDVAAVENCETSAVGRALAMMGLEVKKGIASREEVEKAERQRKSSATMTEQVVPDEMVKVIADLAKSKAISSDAITAQLKEMGVKGFRTTSAGVKKLKPEQLAELEQWIKQQEDTDGDGDR